MTELLFKGKEFVYNHHLAIPYRSLEVVKNKGIGKSRLDENLIIHGDNLHALKSLLPLYAGKVDCVCIDPPYNTGVEGWRYNDNVNSPMIKEWLKSEVGLEDGLRHDKWCSMMWPRLRLLCELLCEEGFIFIFIDDNEHYRLRAMLDEIFGEENFIGVIAWKKTSGDNTAPFAFTHDNIVIYGKGGELSRQPLTPEQKAQYSNPDNDPRGDWAPSDYRCRRTKEERPNLYYAITNPNTGEEIYPDTHTDSRRVWGSSIEVHKQNEIDGLIWWGGDGKSNEPKKKRFLSGHKGTNTRSIWLNAGTNDDAGNLLKQILPDNKFDNPKPVSVVKRIVQTVAGSDSLILDSFAGSGTTAHAVLQLNKEDGGKRKFILIEMENYADSITAERIRRIIKGYNFSGAQKTELLRENITWTKIKNSSNFMNSIEKIEKLHVHKYSKIDKSIKKGELIITGIKDIKECVEGLGGNFTYCTLSDPVEFDNMLSGKHLPSYESLGRTLFHMSTLCILDSKKIKKEKFYLGVANGTHVWMKYKPDINWLKSSDAALTLDWAKQIAKRYKNKNHLVFAPACYVSRSLLNENNTQVEFIPLPYALYGIGGIHNTHN